MPVTWQTKNGVSAFVQIGETTLLKQNNQKARQTTALARVAWTSRRQFEMDCLGWTWIISSGGIISNLTQWTRSLPEFLPTDPEQICVACDMYKMDGGSNSSGTPPGIGSDAFGWPAPIAAYYKLTFQTPDYFIEDDSHLGAAIPGELSRYVVRKPAFRARELTVPGGGFTYGKTGLTLYQAGFVIVPELELHYIWKEIPLSWVPTTAIQSNQGRINANAFDFGIPGQPAYPAQTVLFATAQQGEPYVRIMPLNGIVGQPMVSNLFVDITYIFRVRNSSLAGGQYLTWNQGLTITGQPVTLFSVPGPFDPGGLPPYANGGKDRLGNTVGPPFEALFYPGP